MDKNTLVHFLFRGGGNAARNQPLVHGLRDGAADYDPPSQLFGVKIGCMQDLIIAFRQPDDDIGCTRVWSRNS